MSKRAILCVDDEATVLKSLKKELSEAYQDKYLIEFASNGYEAIEIFDELSDDGFTVMVVISDYIMPGMKGDEMLEIIHEKNSRTYKIMLTGQAESKGISNAVNKANLFRILTKPWSYDELVFTINEAIKNYLKNEFIERQYLELKKNKEVTETLKRNNFKVNRILQGNKEFFNMLIPALLKLTTTYEPGYFVGPTRFITNVALQMASELGLETNERTNIVVCVILLHIINENMPEEFVGVDPCQMEITRAREYFRQFNIEIDKLSSIPELNSHTRILASLWEHYDGTGLPHNLTVNKLTKVSQILNLLINYHSGVYKFPENASERIEHENEIYQVPEETSRRHAATLQRIFKNTSWYDLEIMEVFHKLLKSKACEELHPEHKLHKVYFYGDEIRTAEYSVEEFKYDEDMKIVIPIEKLLEADRKQKTMQKEKKEKKKLETSLGINDLRPGMILGQDITTKFGRLVISSDTLIEDWHLDEIKELVRNQLLKEDASFKIFIPREV